MPRDSLANLQLLGIIRAEHQARTVSTLVLLDDQGRATAARALNALGRTLRAAPRSDLLPPGPTNGDEPSPGQGERLPPATPGGRATDLPRTPRAPAPPREAAEPPAPRPRPTELVPEVTTLLWSGQTAGAGGDNFGSWPIPWPCVVKRINITTTSAAPAAAAQIGMELYLSIAPVPFTNSTGVIAAPRLLRYQREGTPPAPVTDAILIPTIGSISFAGGVTLDTLPTFIGVAIGGPFTEVMFTVAIDIEELSPSRRRTANRPDPVADPQPPTRRFEQPRPRDVVRLIPVPPAPPPRPVFREETEEDRIRRLMAGGRSRADVVFYLANGRFPEDPPIGTLVRRNPLTGRYDLLVPGQAPVDAAAVAPAAPLPTGSPDPPPPPAPTTRARNTPPADPPEEPCPDINTLRQMFMRAIATGPNADRAAQSAWEQLPQRCKDRLQPSVRHVPVIPPPPGLPPTAVPGEFGPLPTLAMTPEERARRFAP